MFRTYYGQQKEFLLLRGNHMTRIEAHKILQSGNHTCVNWLVEFYDGGWIKETIGALDRVLAQAWELEVLFGKKVRISKYGK